MWSWDNTDLASPWRGVSFKAYSIIDIYSRKLVGYRVEDREVDALAVQMFQDAFAGRGAPDGVYADSGPAMRSNSLKGLLDAHGVTRTHNRPRVLNDNPFSESEFRTMKYRPNYPRVFDTLEQARAFMDVYVPWYNQNHKHSGIALFSPDQVHDGSWRHLWQHRGRIYQAHPERFRDRPTTPMPVGFVGINTPAERAPQGLTQPRRTLSIARNPAMAPTWLPTEEGPMARRIDRLDGTTWWSRKTSYGQLAIVMAVIGVLVAVAGVLVSNTPAFWLGVGFIGVFAGIVLHSLDRASRRQ